MLPEVTDGMTMHGGPRWAETPDAPPYPLEPVRHRYITVLGGLSEDLNPWEIGIDAEALERNTRLRPFQDRVHVTGEGETPRPLFTRDLFTIVPLDASRPGAHRFSPGGEAVFSTDAFDELTLDHPAAAFDAQAPIVLNATLGRRVRGDEAWFRAILAKLVDARGRGGA